MTLIFNFGDEGYILLSMIDFVEIHINKFLQQIVCKIS